MGTGWPKAYQHGQEGAAGEEEGGEREGEDKKEDATSKVKEKKANGGQWCYEELEMEKNEVVLLSVG